MPRPDAPPLTRAVVVRGVGFGLAIALGAVAVWLIVTGSMSPRRIEIGVLAGLWGLLLGAYTMFGARRPHGDIIHYVSSAELELRSGGGLEQAVQADARRAFEERLENLLRTEISNSVSREVGDLRREVAALRQELLEKVGGELRLERIETTRLIGSDLEALQREVRQLKSARDSTGIRTVVESATIPVAAERVAAAPPTRRDSDAATHAIESQAAAERQRADAARAEQAAHERAAYEKASRERAEREQAERERAEREQAQREQAQREQARREQARREQAQREQAQRERAEREQAQREQARREQAQRERAEREQAQRERAERGQAQREREQAQRERAAQQKAASEKAAADQAAAEQAAREKAAAERSAVGNGTSNDPFASLPRITPFTDFELDPIETPSATHGSPSDDGPTYTGRRRAGGAEGSDGADSADLPDAAAGRHSRGGADASNGGRRRRRDDDDDEDGLDLLSQLLSRGSADR